MRRQVLDLALLPAGDSSVFKLLNRPVVAMSISAVSCSYWAWSTIQSLGANLSLSTIAIAVFSQNLTKR